MTISSERFVTVLMTGPVQAQAGGMAAVIRNLSATGFCRLHVLDTGKETVDNRPLYKGIWSQLVLCFSLIHLILREDINVLHIHTCSGFTFWRDCLHFLLGKLLARRIVWHIHGAKFDHFLEKRTGFIRKFVDMIFSKSDAVVVLSEQWKTMLKQYSPGANWTVIQNGIPFPQASNLISEDTTTFLFLGNLGSRKGVMDLVEATQKVFERGGQCMVKIAGNETSTGEKGRLLKKIEQFGLSLNVKYLGIISGDVKDEVLRAADVVVLPSYAEGLPIALLEGMAHGIPVISTSVGGIPELISHGEDGFLLEPGDVEALADAMEKFVTDRTQLKNMGQAAREKISRGYSIEAMAEKLNELYASLG